jgi:hypothetical protein
VPRTRSSHPLAANPIANFGFKRGTRIIELLVSLDSEVRMGSLPQVRANFGIGTLGPEHGRVQTFIVQHLCKRSCARLQWAFAGASQPDGSVPPFRALSR